MVYRPVWLAVACALAGCPGGDDPPPMCITVDSSCAPLYTPTFANVYTMTIRPSCGPTNSSCHSASGEGGLSFADEQTAYDNLLGGRVTAGDPGCSEFVVRTSSPGADYQMPPGGALSAPARCALLQWVQNGAQR